MHEWALAEAAVRSAVGESRKDKLKRISEVVIRIGELQQLDGEAFRFALESAWGAHREDLGEARFVIEMEKAAFTCRSCGHEWAFDAVKRDLPEDEAEFVHFMPEMAHAYMRCGKCGSPDFSLTKGRGVWLDRVTGEIGA
ncbi:MAG: hydrogenase nickel incorporation protein HypA [Elusimicrobiota bacterium]|jgi:hydrogenase nickel incorporation protein HypA/HybF